MFISSETKNKNFQFILNLTSQNFAIQLDSINANINKFSSPLTNLTNLSNILKRIKRDIKTQSNIQNLRYNLYIHKSNNELDLESLLNVVKDVPLNYAIFMFGYILPILLFVTILFNSMIVIVLLQKHLRTSTNIILLSMAIFDMLTLIFPAPWYFYVFTLGKYKDYLNPAYICYLFHCMSEVIPAFFHTASIWFTLLLAGQRYIYVCHPITARNWCTLTKVIRSLILIILIAFSHQFSRFFDRNYIDVQVKLPSKIVKGCQFQTAVWVKKYVGEDLYFSTYYGFRIVFVHVIPCTILVILNLLLFRTLKLVQKNRNKLLFQSVINKFNKPDNYLKKKNLINAKFQFKSILKSTSYFNVNKTFKRHLNKKKKTCSSIINNDIKLLDLQQSSFQSTIQFENKLSTNEPLVILVNKNNKKNCHKLLYKSVINKFNKPDNYVNKKNNEDKNFINKKFKSKSFSNLDSYCKINQILKQNSDKERKTCSSIINNDIKLLDLQQSSFKSKIQFKNKLSTSEPIFILVNNSNNKKNVIKKTKSSYHLLSHQLSSLKHINQTLLKQNTNYIKVKHENILNKTLPSLPSSSTVSVNYKQFKLANENRKQRDTNCITLMLIAIVSVFLITEIPLAVTTILHVVQNVLDVYIVNYQTLNSTILFSNFFIMLSYPVNFAIYCEMNVLFKQTFKNLFFNYFLSSKKAKTNVKTPISNFITN